MGRFFRDIWAQVIAAGVLAAMTILIGKLQEIDPLLLAIGTFIVLLIAFRIVYHLQERKLVKRLNIEKERWDRIREERIRVRQQYSNRTIIPDLLYQMGERVRELMEKTPLVLADDMADDFREIMQLRVPMTIKLNRADAKQLLAKFPSVRHLKDPTQRRRALVMSTYQVLTAHGQGAKFVVEKDEEYQRLDKQVEELLVGLPRSIHIKKGGYGQLVNAYYTLAAVDYSKGELPRLFRLYEPFMKAVIVTELSTMRAEISSLIEQFLIGEDMK
jgi:hypothetical protein